MLLLLTVSPSQGDDDFLKFVKVSIWVTTVLLYLYLDEQHIHLIYFPKFSMFYWMYLKERWRILMWIPLWTWLTYLPPLLRTLSLRWPPYKKALLTLTDTRQFFSHWTCYSLSGFSSIMCTYLYRSRIYWLLKL